jgi:hypothetical protein
MFMNYMDYVDDDTMVMFSKGQLERMNATLAGPRASLLVSKGLLPVATPRIALPVGGGAVPAASILLGAERGDRVEKVFDGVSWVPVG